MDRPLGAPPAWPPAGGPPGAPPPGGLGGAPPGGYRPPALKMQQPAHQTGLAPSLLALFAPHDPLPYAAPVKKRPVALPYSGVGAYLHEFEEPADAPPPVPATPKETKEQKALRRQEAARDKGAALLERALLTWNPASDPKVQGDPLKTLFVGRLSYDVSESKLRREFEAYGPVKSLRIVHDAVTDKPRGYAFVEFHSGRDLKTAFRAADSKKLEGRRLVADVERGRTVPGWLPRRLGGGLGGTRLGGKKVNVVVSGRDARAHAGPSVADEPQRAERERERAPRGDTRPGADRERPRERSRDRDRSPERRRRSRSRDHSRERKRRDRSKSRDRHRSDRRRSRSRDRSEHKRERKRDRDDAEAGRDEKRARAPPPPVVAKVEDDEGPEAGEIVA